MSYFIKQSTAVLPLQFLLVSSSDHISPATGLTPTVVISKAGGLFATPSGAVSEIANGWYQVAANATDSNTLGPLILHASGSGADPTDSVFQIVAYDPSSGTNLGLSGLTTAAPGAAGGMLTVGTGSGQINPDGTGAVPLAFGTALPTSPVANTVGEAIFFADIMGGRVNVAQGGTSTTITLDASASSDTNAYIGDDIYLYGGTGGGVRGSGQRRTIIAYNTSTKVATVQRAWDTNPDSTTKFMTLPQPQANVGLWNNSAVGVALPGTGTLSTYTGGAADADAATILTQVNKIGTNSADSPNAVTAQGTISTNLNATVSSRSTYAGGAVASVTAPVTITAIQQAMISGGFLTSSGGSFPTTTDTYIITGVLNGHQYYQGISTGLYIWNDGAGDWNITSVLGTFGNNGFGKIGSNPAGTYQPQISSTGNPTVVAYGNASINSSIPGVTIGTSTYTGGAADADAATILAQVNLIGTNAADSPNAVTAHNTISTNLNATVSSRSTYAGGAVASVTAPVQVDMTQTVPTSNTVQTLGDALNAARAQGFGKWVISGTTLTLYAGDGTTVVRTFTLDSSTAPTQRS